MEKYLALSRRVMVIHSPHSGKSAHLSQALTLLQEAGVIIVDVLSIAELNGLPKQGNRWKASGIDAAVAAGGDGLIGGITAHLADSDLPLGILPLGTANDIARTVGIPLDLQQAAEVIASGLPTAIDIGVAYPQQQTESLAPSGEPASAHSLLSEQLFFTHALTVGVNVEFARLATSPVVRQQYGQMTYPYAVLEAVKVFKAFAVELRFDGLCVYPNASSSPIIKREPTTLSCSAAQVTVVNAPVFWGALQATVPEASLSDHTLDIVVVEDASLLNLITRTIRFFSRQEQCPASPTSWHAKYPALLPAERTDITGIHHVQTQAVTITTEGECQDVTLDGEIRSHTPIYVCAADERLQLILPRDREALHPSVKKLSFGSQQYHWKGSQSWIR